jgi:transposase
MSGEASNLRIIEPRSGCGEVLSGPERRRRWSASEKARIVAESLAPDAVGSLVARRHGIHPNQLYGWRRELRSGMAEDRDVPAFVPVTVTAAPEASPPAPSAAPIEIVIGLATVRVPPLADATTLRLVLDSLRRLG